MQYESQRNFIKQFRALLSIILVSVTVLSTISILVLSNEENTKTNLRNLVELSTRLLKLGNATFLGNSSAYAI